MKKKLSTIPGTLALSACLIAGVASGSEPQAAADWQLVRIGEMAVPRAAHQATLLPSGKVLITGGCTAGCRTIHDSVEVYDPDTRSFSPAGTLSVPRVSHAAALLADGRVLVVGGWTGRRPLASAEIRDPHTGQWSSAGAMSGPRMSAIATRLADGRVLITGGARKTGAPLDSAEIFDPADGTFSRIGPMNARRGSQIAVALADGRVLLVGGHEARGAVLRSAEIFDPVASEFQPTGEMALPRHKHAAARLPDGRVLVLAGSGAGDYGDRYASTEIYDPATGRFAPGPELNAPRHKIRDAVITLPTGAVLMAGGARQAEIYDPGAGVFLPVTGQLSGPQMFATATLLAGGEVLVLGGYDDRIQSSASAWMISPAR